MTNYVDFYGDPIEWIVHMGPDIVPVSKMNAALTKRIFNTQLNSTSFMMVDSQAATDALIQMINKTGCLIPTGTEFPVALALLTAQMFDSYGIPIPGGPTEGDLLRIDETTPGNQIALYGVSTDPNKSKQLPFVTKFYAGEAIGLIPYGKFDITDGDGNTRTAPGTADPVVQAPEVNVLYDTKHFFVNNLNELALITDGGAGAYQPTNNIRFIPGATPDTAPGIEMLAGGSIDAGPHLWAYCWLFKDATGTTICGSRSPLAFGNSVTAGGFKSARISLPARPDDTVIGIRVIRTDKTADEATLKLVTDITTGLDAPQTSDDVLADAALTTAYADPQTKIDVQKWLLQTEPGPTTLDIPAAQITKGKYGQREALSGYTYLGLYDYAYDLTLLDANDPQDSHAWVMRNTDATFPSILAGLIAPDYSATPPGTDLPGSLNAYLCGYVQGAGGIVTVVLDHSPPVDADVAIALNGMIALCSNDNSEWARLSGSWRKIGSIASWAQAIAPVTYSMTIVPTIVTWADVASDTDNYFDPSNPTYFTIPFDGWYELDSYFLVEDRSLETNTWQAYGAELIINGSVDTYEGINTSNDENMSVWSWAADLTTDDTGAGIQAGMVGHFPPIHFTAGDTVGIAIREQNQHTGFAHVDDGWLAIKRIA